MSKPIPAYWHNSLNFGDAMTPYIIQKVTGRPAKYTEDHMKETLMMVTGSMLGTPQVANSLCWGLGYIAEDAPTFIPAKVLAVRGKLTQEKLLKEREVECDVIGDPALLLPKWYKPDPDTIEKKYELGILAHVIDHRKAAFLYGKHNEVLLINLFDPIEKIIYDIHRCEQTISSSLHGLIASHAYGIPCLWVEFSDKVIGKGFKFRDYFSSVGIEPYEPLDIRKKVKVSEVIEQITWSPLYFNAEALWQACPFKPKEE